MQKFSDLTAQALYEEIISGTYKTDFTLTIGSNTYGRDKIISMSTDAVLWDDLSIGNVISRAIKATVTNDCSVPTGAVLIPRINVYNETKESDFFNKGVYYIAKRTINRLSNTITLEGYDCIMKSDVVYFKSGTWVDKSTLAVAQEIATELGTTLNDATTTLLTNNPKTLSAPPVMGTDGTTEREMLSFIAVLYGGNWITDDNGKLQLIQLISMPAPDLLCDENGNVLTIGGTCIVI